MGRRFPKKNIRFVKSGTTSTTIDGFLFGIKLAFQRGQAKSLKATYHFTFTGPVKKIATIKIIEGKLSVHEGHIGQPDLEVKTESNFWLRFINKEISLARMILTGKLKLKGNPKLLADFGKCFVT